MLLAACALSALVLRAAAAPAVQTDYVTWGQWLQDQPDSAFAADLDGITEEVNKGGSGAVRTMDAGSVSCGQRAGGRVRQAHNPTSPRLCTRLPWLGLPCRRCSNAAQCWHWITLLKLSPALAFLQFPFLKQLCPALSFLQFPTLQSVGMSSRLINLPACAQRGPFIAPAYMLYVITGEQNHYAGTSFETLGEAGRCGKAGHLPPAGHRCRHTQLAKATLCAALCSTQTAAVCRGGGSWAESWCALNVSDLFLVPRWTQAPT